MFFCVFKVSMYNLADYHNQTPSIHFNGVLLNVNIRLDHKINELMSCVHGPNIRFKNKDCGCRNPTTSN